MPRERPSAFPRIWAISVFGSMPARQAHADVAMQGKNRVAGLQVEAGADGGGFLPDAGEDAPEHFALAVEDGEPLLERAAQEHAVVEVQERVGRSVRFRRAFGHVRPFQSVSRESAANKSERILARPAGRRS